MSSVHVDLDASNALDQADLLEWLRARGVPADSTSNPSHMGAAETISLVLSSAAGLRGAFLVVREWIKARQTTVSVKTPGGLEYSITSSTSDEALAVLIDRIRSEEGAGDSDD